VSSAEELIDLAPDSSTVAAVARSGLTAMPKTLPAWLLYDERGSELFDQICRLDEYYPTRTEIQILEADASAIAQALGPRCQVVELGSGSGLKTEILLANLTEPAEYVALDVSAAALQQLQGFLTERFPALPIRAICMDYQGEIDIGPRPDSAHRTVVFFPGSTVGNMEPAEAESFLGRLVRMCGPGGGLLIGVDRKKDPALLEAAYNDAEGITAAFNLNLLTRLNREIGANFDIRRFGHRAVYDPSQGRIEMHLVSERRQTVRLGRSESAISVDFDAAEHIVTEHSYKYDVGDFAALAGRAGWLLTAEWSDPRSYFSVLYLES
jgi:dimethylhistidine N-methyltransferase